MDLGKDIPGQDTLDTVYIIVPGCGKARRAEVGLGKDIPGQGILDNVYTVHNSTVPGWGKARSRSGSGKGYPGIRYTGHCERDGTWLWKG